MYGPSVSEIKRRNEASGGCYFEPGTMRFFRSRVMCDTFRHPDGRVFFVTSEKRTGFRCEDGPRLYSVRVQATDGSIDTVGEFQGYRSRSGALAAARRFAEAP